MIGAPAHSMMKPDTERCPSDMAQLELEKARNSGYGLGVWPYTRPRDRVPWRYLKRCFATS